MVGKRPIYASSTHLHDFSLVLFGPRGTEYLVDFDDNAIFGLQLDLSPLLFLCFDGSGATWAGWGADSDSR